jgi:EAL and modified HD-GYP domain-containing signal transduction protein
LLRYLNSASFGLRAEVRSIRHALTLLGEKGIKRWVTLVSMLAMGEKKPSELQITALARARFCERLAAIVGMGDKSEELFLMGLLSMLDAVVDRPLADCLNGVPIAEDLKEALLGGPGRYRDLLDVPLHYEKSDWGSVFRSARRLDIKPSEIPKVYLDAIQWSQEVYNQGRAEVTV